MKRIGSKLRPRPLKGTARLEDCHVYEEAKVKGKDLSLLDSWLVRNVLLRLLVYSLYL
ncbi:MAG: hypothetical protein GXX92_03115 [Clostridiales bacterium]|nr:hypothetical protein [Clostridiales bacterium]